MTSQCERVFSQYCDGTGSSDGGGDDSKFSLML
jgi:hypothetical protein